MTSDYASFCCKKSFTRYHVNVRIHMRVYITHPRGCEYRTIRLRKALGETFPMPIFLEPRYRDVDGKPPRGHRRIPYLQVRTYGITTRICIRKTIFSAREEKLFIRGAWENRKKKKREKRPGLATAFSLRVAESDRYFSTFFRPVKCPLQRRHHERYTESLAVKTGWFEQSCPELSKMLKSTPFDGTCAKIQ